MRQRKHNRDAKRQLGQFMTPKDVVDRVLTSLGDLRPQRVLEPSCGSGAFLAGLARLARGNSGKFVISPETTITGIEIDSELASSISRSEMPQNTTVAVGDFFRLYIERSSRKDAKLHSNPLDEQFDLIIGNPPFGGTFDHDIEDDLDRLLGYRLGCKIKKETYAFFIVACVDLLSEGGRLVFVCSDTLMTIATMSGLRQFLMEHGDIVITELSDFSDETSYPMVILDFRKRLNRSAPLTVVKNGVPVDPELIQKTPNLSWNITADLSRLFAGPLLSEYFIVSSGMTTGKNEYFVRSLGDDGSFEEPYEFAFREEPVTLAYEQERARLGRLSPKVCKSLQEAEARGDVERRLVVIERDAPERLRFPHPDYKPYNKANGKIVASAPSHVIFWKDSGDAVLTYKKTGNWYLRGVGGQPYFGREGLTWQLVASKWIPRYLPEGYILDSGGPCAFTRPSIPRSELFFVLGWLLSPLATNVLKSVINHTRNIQSKDFERLPYPWWVPLDHKQFVIKHVSEMVEAGLRGKRWKWDSKQVQDIGNAFSYDGRTYSPVMSELKLRSFLKGSSTSRSLPPTLFTEING